MPAVNCNGIKAHQCVESHGGPEFNPVLQCCLCGGGTPSNISLCDDTVSNKKCFNVFFFGKEAKVGNTITGCFDY